MVTLVAILPDVVKATEGETVAVAVVIVLSVLS